MKTSGMPEGSTRRDINKELTVPKPKRNRRSTGTRIRKGAK